MRRHYINVWNYQRTTFINELITNEILNSKESDLVYMQMSYLVFINVHFIFN